MAKNKSKKQKQSITVEAAKPQNFVAKYAREFNVATVETDRKKEFKKNGGVSNKHKGRREW